MLNRLITTHLRRTSLLVLAAWLCVCMVSIWAPMARAQISQQHVVHLCSGELAPLDAPYAGLPTVPAGAGTAATAGASSQRTGACRPASGLAASSAYSVPRSFASRACTTFEDMDPVLSGTGHLACAWC